MNILRLRPALALLFLLNVAVRSGAQTLADRFRASADDRTRVQASDPETVAAIVNGGGRLVADYGSFQILEANQAALDEFRGAPGVEDRSEQKFILLNAGRIDTDDPPVQAARAAARDFTGKRLHQVQFDTPVKPEGHAKQEMTRSYSPRGRRTARTGGASGKPIGTPSSWWRMPRPTRRRWPCWTT
jgi:hypothetical protein